MIGHVIRLSKNAGQYLPSLVGDMRRLPVFLGMRVVESLLLAAMYMTLYGALQHLFSGTLSNAYAAGVAAFLVACCLSRMVLFHFSAEGIYKGVYAWTGSLRLRAADHLKKLPLGLFQQERLSQIKSIMTEDMQIISQTSGSLLGFFVSAISLPVFITAGLAFVDWKLALVLCASTLICLPLLYGMGRFIHIYGARHFDSIARSSGRLLEYALGIQVLKSYGLTGARFRQLETALSDTKRDILVLEIGAIGILAVARIVVEMGVPALLLYGLNGLPQTLPESVTFIFALVLAMRFYSPIHEAMALSSEFQYLDAAFARVVKVLDLEQQQDTATAVQTSGSAIVFENVSFGYDPKAPVLKSVSFTAAENTITALVGPSGAGKTTVTSLIARFWDVQQGRILIGGVDTKQMSMQDLMSHISIVFQEVALFHDTIFDNIRMARPSATNEEVMEAARLAQAHNFIMQLPDGYMTKTGEGGCRLSGGEKQRISIARALLKQAPIVLLDEATAAIDPSGEKDIQIAFSNLRRNKTVIVIAHKLSTIVQADQILVMESGHIVERGTHNELIALRGLYRDLWSSQSSTTDTQAA